MGRPRSFDPDEILGAALQLFWVRGYQRTSFDDITRATGVNKPSLYAAFGDKATLFARVLDRYHAMLLAHATTTLEGASPRASLEAWMFSFLPACSGAAGGRGCLSVNATLEAAATADPGVKKPITAFNRKIEKILAGTIRRGIDAREFSSSLDADAAARLLLVTQTGLMVLAREKRNEATTRTTMIQALRSLA